MAGCLVGFESSDREEDRTLFIPVSVVEFVIGGLFVPPSSRGESLEIPSE